VLHHWSVVGTCTGAVAGCRKKAVALAVRTLVTLRHREVVPLLQGRRVLVGPGGEAGARAAAGG
jgi:hypothetical protein